MPIDTIDTSLFGLFIDNWPGIFLFDLLRYAIPASLMTVLLALFASKLQHRRIQTRTRTWRDDRRELMFSASTIIIFSFVGLGIAVGEHLGWMKILSGSNASYWQVANMILIVLLHDAYFYWTHRAMHHRKVYRWVHKTHHLSRKPAPWAAYSFAPLEALVEALFLPIYLIFVPTHVLVIAIFLIHMIVRNVLAHAGVELFPRKWMSWPVLRHITVTSHHDMHHEHFDCNYGFYFTWWDRWMGTEHTEYRSRFEGLAGHPLGSTLTSTVCLLVIGTLVAGKAEAKSCTLDGYWVTEGFGAIVEMNSSSDELSGTIHWIFDEEDQKLVGQSLFSRFEREDCRWHSGLILNPQSGRRYRSTITLGNDGNLLIRGCIGPFCQTQKWQSYARVLDGLPSLDEHVR